MGAFWPPTSNRRHWSISRPAKTPRLSAKFKVIDLGLGRVALKAGNGKVVSVASPESVVLKDLGDAKPGDAEIFQWINLMRGDTMLMSLTNHRYLATKPNSPGPVTATATGPNPARKGGACFKWKEVSTTIKPITQTKQGIYPNAETPEPSAEQFPLKDVRLLESPFSKAVQISGPGTIVATDHGDPSDMTPFKSDGRRAFNGLALATVRSKRGTTGRITVSAKAADLTADTVIINLE